MPFADRVQDTTISTGTGDVTLSGVPPTGFVAFDTAFGHTGETFFYCIADDGSNWEVGEGTLVDEVTLERSIVLKSSNGDALVDFVTGEKSVFNCIPAEWADSVVIENAAITPATKTKITYDGKGLVTAGADATTADIADSTNKRYVTDGELTVIGNTSGVNTGDQTITLTGEVTGSGTGSFATAIATGLDAAKIADGSVSNTEFQYLNSVTSNVQTQLNGKFTLPALTAGSVLFSDGSTIAQDNAKFFWDNTNNRLGIGTTSPSVTFHLYEASASTVALFESNDTTNAVMKLRNVNTNDSDGMQIGARGTEFRFDNRQANGVIAFWTDNGTAEAERMRIAANGNLGVGTSTPTAGKLVVADTTLSGSGSLNGSAVAITQTWNTTGVPTAIKLDVTHTAAGVNPLLMDLRKDGSSRFAVRYSGETVQAGTMNSTNVQVSGGGLLLFGGRSYFTSPANSVLCMFNNAGTDFGRLQFGGTTSSFPSIKRSSTLLQARLADDSAYSGFEASTLRTATAYTVATLPAAGTAGRRAYVTDATAPTFLGALTGGGSVVCPVFDNGTAWVAGG